MSCFLNVCKIYLVNIGFHVTYEDGGLFRQDILLFQHAS